MGQQKRVIVVGAGLGGLASAYWLGRSGFDVEVLEASGRPGGRVMTLERGGDRVDVGAQFFHSSYRYAPRLLRELGLWPDRRPFTAAQHFSMVDGRRWKQNSSSPFFGPLGVRANFDFLRFVLRHVLLAPMTRLHHIDVALPSDSVTVADLHDGQDASLFNEYLLPLLCIAMNVASPNFTSAQHLAHIFRITAFTEMFGLRGGNACLPEALASRVPVQYGSPVAALVMNAGRIVGVQMEGSGEVRTADHVILAVDPANVARLLPTDLSTEAEFFRSIIRIPQPLPVLFLDRPLRRDIFAYMGDPRSGNSFVMALDAMAKVPDMVPSGRSILTLWSYHPKTAVLDGLTDDQIADLARNEVGALVPGLAANWIEEIRILRHAYSHPPYAAGSYARILAFKERAAAIDGLSFVSDLFGGSYMECALISAAEAVKRVCAWGGTDF